MILPSSKEFNFRSNTSKLCILACVRFAVLKNVSSSIVIRSSCLGGRALHSLILLLEHPLHVRESYQRLGLWSCAWRPTLLHCMRRLGADELVVLSASRRGHWHLVGLLLLNYPSSCSARGARAAPLCVLRLLGHIAVAKPHAEVRLGGVHSADAAEVSADHSEDDLLDLHRS